MFTRWCFQQIFKQTLCTQFFVLREGRRGNVWRCWNYWSWNSTAQVGIWTLPRKNCSEPPVWNILYTLLVAVICVGRVVRRGEMQVSRRTTCRHLIRRCLLKLQHGLQIGWFLVHKHTLFDEEKNIALNLSFKLFDAVIFLAIFFGLATLL